MAARPGSEQQLDLSLDEVEVKLKEFIGDKISIDCNGCDNCCLALWMIICLKLKKWIDSILV